MQFTKDVTKSKQEQHVSHQFAEMQSSSISLTGLKAFLLQQALKLLTLPTLA